MQAARVVKNAVIALMSGAMIGAACLYAELPQLWPTFSTPASIENVDILNTNASPDDLLAEKTLIGAYNQLQGKNRIYLSDSADASYWLKTLIPASIAVSNLQWNHNDPDGALKGLLDRFGRSISGYYVCDPVNNPETCNMATTLAGIHQAMVVNPDNLAIVAAYHLSLLSDLRKQIWIGDDEALVDNSAINTIDNPSGSRGTAGWQLGDHGEANTLSAASIQGGTALAWKITAQSSTDPVLFFEPQVKPGIPYCFSAQLAGAGAAWLKVWDGAEMTAGAQIILTPAFQTLQQCIRLPLTSGQSRVRLELHRAKSPAPATVYVRNAAAIEEVVAVDSASFKNIGQANARVLAQDGNDLYNKRDYDIAAKLFTFNLTSTDPAQKELYSRIINSTPHNTPIMGYPATEHYEKPDVVFLSGPGEEHFLSASARYDNGSVWASLPQLSTLFQPAPSPIRAQKGTIYISFAASEGDNMTYVEHRMEALWTESQFFGAVPMAWTVPPGAIEFSPAMLSYYFHRVPQSSELMAGPSGVGYVTAMSGENLKSFGAMTTEFIKAEHLRSITVWPWNAKLLSEFASGTHAQHVVWRFPCSYAQIGGSLVDGQAVSYNDTPAAEIQAIEEYVAKHYSANEPLFVEALADAWHLSPDDMLYIAQILQQDSQHPYVFITPSAMALTEQAYYGGTSAGLPAASPQAVTGATLLHAYPENRLLNGDTLSAGGGVGMGSWRLASPGRDESLMNTEAKGAHVQRFTAAGNDAPPASIQSEISVPLADQYYPFAVSAAGLGLARLCVDDNGTSRCTAAVKLSSAFQSIAETVLVHDLKARVRLEIQSHGVAAPFIDFRWAAGNPSHWYFAQPGRNTAALSHLSATNYNGSPSFLFAVPANQGKSQWVANYPEVKPGQQYDFSVDVAGSGMAYLDAFDGSASHRTRVVRLRSAYQTLSVTGISIEKVGAALRIVSPASTSVVRIYLRRPAVLQERDETDYSMGFEAGATDPIAANHDELDNGADGIQNVRDAFVLPTANAISHSGAGAIEYRGTADGGGTARAYLTIVHKSVTLRQTSRLSYWIFPVSQADSKRDDGVTSGHNKTCVALDVVFTDGTSSLSYGVKDQFGNPLTPHGECGHLVFGQWNFITADLSGLSGKTISRIDVGYEQSGAIGQYRGYIDDLRLSH